MNKFDRRKKGWFWAFNNIFDIGLSTNELAVYCLLCRMVGDAGDEVCPSKAYIGKKLGISIPTVSKALSGLEKKLMINVERRNAKSGGKITNEYSILDGRNL